MLQLLSSLTKRAVPDKERTIYTYCRPEELARLAEEVEVASMVVDLGSGLLLYANRRACAGISKAPYEILGRHYRQVFRPEFVPLFNRLADECRDGKEHTSIYYWAEKHMWEQLSAKVITWGAAPAVLLSITNINELARSEYMAENKLYFDHVSKLPNGEKLEADINELASTETVALLYIYIERFADINNLYGWEGGNQLLLQIRDWLLASELHHAQIYRVDNGFAILGRGTTMEDAKDRSKKIVRRFKQPWSISAGGQPLSVFCSVKLGIVHGKYIKNEMRNLLIRTIQAVQPGEAYAVYDEEADKRATRDLELRNALINCIHNSMRGFEVYYQPIVRTQTAQWAAVEALCRWTAPDGSRVPPNVFIGMAEQLGLIGQLDSWVRKTAMCQCVELGLHKKDFILDINFSPTQKLNKAFINSLCAVLDETGFPAEKLNLEITESAKMSFDDENVAGLEQLASKGIILSLDDFGTGYSTLENLINISVSLLKTEKVFLDGIENDSYRQYLLRMLVDLTCHLNINMVAEGVETEAQYQLLKGYSVKYVQGYLFSRPLSFQQLKQEAWRFE